VAITFEGSARRIFGVSVDAADAEEIGVGGGEMTAGVGDEDRMIGGSHVEEFAGRVPSQFHFIIGCTADKHSFGGNGGLSFEQVDEAGHGIHCIQFECGVGFVPAVHGERVLMDIIETRHDGSAMEVDDPGGGADILPDEGGVAGCDDEGACNGYGLRAVTGGPEGNEVAVGEDEVGGLGEGGRLSGGLGKRFLDHGGRKGEGEQEQEGEEESHEIRFCIGRQGMLEQFEGMIRIE
jgi:hypothetical protein